MFGVDVKMVCCLYENGFVVVGLFVCVLCSLLNLDVDGLYLFVPSKVLPVPVTEVKERRRLSFMDRLSSVKMIREKRLRESRAKSATDPSVGVVGSGSSSSVDDVRPTYSSSSAPVGRPVVESVAAASIIRSFAEIEKSLVRPLNPTRMWEAWTDAGSWYGLLSLCLLNLFCCIKCVGLCV